MLSLFPDLFFLRELAPLILRIVLGGIVLSYGYKKYKTEFRNTQTWAEIILEVVGGILLIIGFVTQLGAALIALDRLWAIWKNKRENVLGANYEFELLLLVVAISMIVLGPGAFSIDLPF